MFIKCGFDNRYLRPRCYPQNTSLRGPENKRRHRHCTVQYSDVRRGRLHDHHCTARQRYNDLLLDSRWLCFVSLRTGRHLAGLSSLPNIAQIFSRKEFI